MLNKGPAKKVTIWVNEETAHHRQPLWLAVFEYLRHKRVQGASVTRTQMSFGDRHILHHADSVEAHGTAYRVEFVEAAERVDEVLPTLYDMVSDGLIEVHDTTVIKHINKDHAPELAAAALQRRQGKARMMRVFLGEQDRWHGEPLYDAIVKRLRMQDIAGATVYRGILGYGAKREPQRTHLLHISENLPLMISVIDTPEKIAEAAAIVEEMLGDGLIAISDVDIVRIVHGNPKERSGDGFSAR
jgi:PII-like signaling protein